MVETHHLERRSLEEMSMESCKAFLCPSAAGHYFSGGLASLAIAFLPFFLYSCAMFGEATPEPDTVSPTRSQLIAATGGFICLYREGANPVDQSILLRLFYL